MLRFENKVFVRYVIWVLFLIAILAIGTYLIRYFGYGVSYQVSPSMPEGFYFIEPAKNLKRNDIVIFYPPKNIKKFLLEHHWIPHDGLLMKYVVGVPGDWVCKKGNVIWINHKRIANVYRFYATNKLLPNWKFCVTLKHNQFLLMSTRVERSFDGRYFGPTSRQYIIGKAIKID